MFPQGDTTGPKCRGLEFPEGGIADPNAQLGYRRVGTVGVELFFRADSYEFPPASEEDPRRENRRFGPAPCFRGLVFPQGDTTGPKTPGLVFPEGDIADANVQRGYRRVGTVGFDHLSGAIRADSCVFPPTSEEDPRRETAGSASRRAPEVGCSSKGTPQAHSAEAWSSQTGTLQAQIPTRPFTLLSDTPQTKRCCSGSPHPIFHRGPLRRLSWMTCHILARSRI